jgi:hypothetical protein
MPQIGQTRRNVKSFSAASYREAHLFLPIRDVLQIQPEWKARATHATRRGGAKSSALAIRAIAAAPEWRCHSDDHGVRKLG